MLHNCFHRPDLCANVCIVTGKWNYLQIDAAVEERCTLAADDSDCFFTGMCQAVTVLGLPPNICIDKGYFNGKFGLGPNCKYFLCRQGKIADLRFSPFLQEVQLAFSSLGGAELWVARVLSSEMRGASAILLLGKVTQWVEVKTSRRALACIHKMVLTKPGHKMVFLSFESLGSAVYVACHYEFWLWHSGVFDKSQSNLVNWFSFPKLR